MLDVVIPYHGRYDWLSVCLAALARFSSNPIRVILVDNASEPDDSIAPATPCTKLESVIAACEEINPRMTIERVRLGENRSFSHSINAGVAHGSSKYICLLNSDVVVTPGWDAALLAHLADETVGLVGPRTNYAIGLQGGGVDTAQGPPFLVFFCVALRRAVWDAVGPLDAETFGDWCGGEDLDYSWRVKESGWKLQIADFFVHHGGSQTYRSLVKAEAQNAMHERAELRLKTKWGQESYERLRKLPAEIKVGIGVIMIDRRIDYEYFRCMYDLLAHYSSTRGPGAGRQIHWCDVSRFPPGAARNMVGQWAVEHPAKLDYLLMIDDDMGFPPHFLSRLIDHQVDVVAGLAYKRRPPHGTVAYSWRKEGEGYLDLNGIEHTGLVKVDAVGFGGVLIKVDVLRAMTKPLFDFNAKFGEDLGFCKKAQDEAKAEIYVDTELVMAHMGDPIRVDEGYVKAYRQAQAAKAQQHEPVVVQA